MEKKPKILLISNNPISTDTNNGITIHNFLKSFGQENVINLYFDTSIPTSKLALSYYRITDFEVLKFGCFKKIGNIVEINQNNDSERLDNSYHKNKKTAGKMLIRDFLWIISRWNNKKLKKWLLSFNPNCIVLQIGDSPFAIRIANKLRKQLGNIPLFIYNSENYYFKNFDYFEERLNKSFLYSIFYKKLRKQYKLISKKSTWFHLTESIKKKYEVEFKQSNHFIVRNTPNFKPAKYESKKDRFNICYFGNLRLGRLSSLLDVARCIETIDSRIELSIYSKETDYIKKAIDSFKQVSYKGFSPIKTLEKEIAGNVDLLVHIEPFDDFSKTDLIDGFSTKIVDCLNSGIPFLIYSPDSLNLYQYLKKYDACYLTNSEESLKRTLIELFENKNIRLAKVNNAQKLVFLNHNKEKNQTLIHNVIISCLNK